VRLLAVWLLLLAVYCAALGIPTAGSERFAGDEPHHLLLAASVVRDGDVDLRNQYAGRDWAEFSSREVAPSGEPTAGRLHEPQGVGVGLLIAPAFAVGGPRGAELFVAAVLALGFALAAGAAGRLVPEPWATGGALLVGLSPPAVGAATTISAEPLAATLLIGAALCALRVRSRARLRYAYGGALMLAVLPWLEPRLALVGVPVAIALVRWTLAERRRLVALLAAELMLGSVVFFARIGETLYGGPLPSWAEAGGTAPSLPFGYADRLGNLAGLWVDRDAGLLRWAPVLGLAFFAGWLLWRSRRERVASVIPERREAELTAELLLAVCCVQWLVTAFAVRDLAGPWFPGFLAVPMLPCAAALCGWALRHARRTGAVLGALTLGATVWLLIARDPWDAPPADVPFGPLRSLLPAFASEPVWPALFTALVLAVLAALAVREWRGHPLRA
jgi:hypothetical protein